MGFTRRKQYVRHPQNSLRATVMLTLPVSNTRAVSIDEFHSIREYLVLFDHRRQASLRGLYKLHSDNRILPSVMNGMAKFAGMVMLSELGGE